MYYSVLLATIPVDNYSTMVIHRFTSNSLNDIDGGFYDYVLKFKLIKQFVLQTCRWCINATTASDEIRRANAGSPDRPFTAGPL